MVFGLTALGLPTVAVAWPGVQDLAGVHLCGSRPLPQPDGRWTCQSGGVAYEGSLVDVSQGLGTPPGIVAPGGRPPYAPYWGSWGPPNRGPSGYDALDPWLGHPRER
jgi:hypothetical protein